MKFVILLFCYFIIFLITCWQLGLTVKVHEFPPQTRFRDKPRKPVSANFADSQNGIDLQRQ
jgi:hypothetical protein